MLSLIAKLVWHKGHIIDLGVLKLSMQGRQIMYGEVLSQSKQIFGNK